MIEEVRDIETILGIIVRSEFEKEGIEFFTPSSFSQQLGYMKRPLGHIIEPHFHLNITRKVSMTKEVLVIKSGKIRVDFYNNDLVYKISKILRTGDVLLLAAGGHGFEFLEKSEIIEIKQGPYSGDLDKKRFKGIADSDVSIG